MRVVSLGQIKNPLKEWTLGNDNEMAANAKNLENLQKAQANLAQAKMGLGGGVTGSAYSSGGTTPKSSSGKSSSAANKQSLDSQLSDYKKYIDAKTTMNEQFEQLQVALAGQNSTKKIEIELNSEKKKTSLLTAEATKLGISKSTIEQTKETELYNFHIGSAKTLKNEKLRLLQEQLNESKIAQIKYLEEMKQADLQKAREAIEQKRQLDSGYFSFQQSQMTIQNAWKNAFGIQTGIQEQQQLQANLTQQLETERQYLTTLGVTKEQMAQTTSMSIAQIQLTATQQENAKEIQDSLLKYQQIQTQANNTSAQIATTSLSQIKNAFSGIQSAGKQLFSGLTDSSQSWGDRVMNICQGVLGMITNIINLMNGFKGISSIFSFGGVATGIGASIFASGGVLPGSFSQAQPIIAHGSEMILNPGQQAKLFAMANGAGGVGTSTSNSSSPESESAKNIVILNQTFNSLEPATAAEMVKNQMPYVKSQILDAINTQSSWRGAIKKATQ